MFLVAFLDEKKMKQRDRNKFCVIKNRSVICTLKIKYVIIDFSIFSYGFHMGWCVLNVAIYGVGCKQSRKIDRVYSIVRFKAKLDSIFGLDG